MAIIAEQRGHGIEKESVRYAAYKDFLTLWKDADPGIPILETSRAREATIAIMAHFSVLSSQLSVLSCQFSVLSSRFSVVSSQFSVVSSQ